jgi:predicted TIM-barrel fold metal-dependent hydrolase
MIAVSLGADACGEIPRVDLVCYALERLKAINYLDRFTGYLRQLGLDKDEVLGLLSGPRSHFEERISKIGDAQGWLANPTQHLDAAAVDFLVTVKEAGLGGDSIAEPDNEDLLDWYASLPATVKTWVGVNPKESTSFPKSKSLRGHPAFAGISLSPFLVGHPIDDDMYAPVIRWAADEGVGVWVHSSAHFDQRLPYDISHPRHLDAVLMRHPDLRVVIGHAGWPWVNEYCILALRFDGVALEFSTFPPQLIPNPEWGLNGLLAHLKSLSGRIFFGSGAVFQPEAYSRLTKQLHELSLGIEANNWNGNGLRKWLDM